MNKPAPSAPPELTGGAGPLVLGLMSCPPTLWGKPADTERERRGQVNGASRRWRRLPGADARAVLSPNMRAPGSDTRGVQTRQSPSPRASVGREWPRPAHGGGRSLEPRGPILGLAAWPGNARAHQRPTSL